MTTTTLNQPPTGDYPQPTRHLAGDPPEWIPPLEAECSFARPYIEPGMEILDAGCGRGLITQDLAQAVFPGRVTGIDLDYDCVTRAAQLSQGLEIRNLHFLTASVYEMPFRTASFDLVFANGLLEHLTSPLLALSEIRRVLRPGGILALGFNQPAPEAPLRDCLSAAGFDTISATSTFPGRVETIVGTAWVR